MIIQKASIILLCAFAFILPGHNPVSSAVTGSENTGTEYNSHTVDAKKPSSDSKSMPSNPSVALPDTVNRSIPDNATVVSPRLASMSNGVVKDLVTGDTVTDPALVGSPEEQPDPLAKTNGHQFIPVSVARVKDSFSQKNAGESDGSDSAREGAQGAGMMDKEMARENGRAAECAPCHWWMGVCITPLIQSLVTSMGHIGGTIIHNLLFSRGMEPSSHNRQGQSLMCRRGSRILVGKQSKMRGFKV